MLKVYMPGRIKSIPLNGSQEQFQQVSRVEEQDVITVKGFRVILPVIPFYFRFVLRVSGIFHDGTEFFLSRHRSDIIRRRIPFSCDAARVLLPRFSWQDLFEKDRMNK
jgi:hypothetical protein